MYRLISVIGIIALLSIAWCSHTPDSNQQSPVIEVPDNTDQVDGEPTDNDRWLEITRIWNLAERVIVTTPQVWSEHLWSMQVTWQVPWNWFFEAKAPIRVVDQDWRIVWESFIQAQWDWMTTDLVEFAWEISRDYPEQDWTDTSILSLMIVRNNESWLPENDALVEVPFVTVQE